MTELPIKPKSYEVTLGNDRLLSTMAASDGDDSGFGLPDPDDFDTRDSEEGWTSFQKKEHSRHPTDEYKDVRRKAGCGCGNCLATLSFLTLIVIIAAGVGAFWVAKPFLNTHQFVLLSDGMEITEAPSEATVFISSKALKYRVPQTMVSVGFIAPSVNLEGHFSNDVVVKGITATCQPGFIYAKNLDVFAVNFEGDGIEVRGKKLINSLQ